VRCDYCSSTVIVPDSLRSPGQAAGGTVSAFDQAQKLAEIGQLVESGRKIEAIKLFRETFHVGLKEAKDAVEAMERHEIIRLGDFTGSDVVIQSAAFGAAAGQAGRPSSSAGRIVGCVILAIVVITGLSILVPAVIGGGLAIWGVSQAEQLISTAESSTTLVDIPTVEFVIELPGQPTAAPTASFASVIQQFGGQEGIGPGFFNDTRRLGIDANGNIYTGDYSGGRVQVFDATGNFLAQWNARSDLYMVGMTAGRQGVVYIIDGASINRYEGMTGAALGPLPYPGQTFFRSLVTAPDGSIVAYAPDRLVRFDSQGNLTLDVTNPFSSVPGFATTHEDLAVDGTGAIYILGSEAIYKFDANGAFVNRFGSQGDGPDQFMTSPTAIAVDGQGRIFANDFKGILIFDNNGRYLDMLELAGVAFDMVVNDQNELIVMDRNSNQVLKYGLNQ
jgi:hypothetical protein